MWNILIADSCVVNNLLCYVKCKMSLLHNELLVKVCVDNFSDHEIADAQALLHRLVQPVDRLQKRKGEDMAVRAMTDILKWLHEVDNDDLPYFVCDDVNVLPSVDVNDIDASLLMKEISLMRNENSNVKTLCQNVVIECSTTIERLQTVVHNLADKVQVAVDSAVSKALKSHERLFKSATEELSKMNTCVNSGVELCPSNSSGNDDKTESSNETDTKSYDGVSDAIDSGDNAKTMSKTELNPQNSEEDEPDFPPLESKPPSPGPTPYVQAVVVPTAQTAAAVSRPGSTPVSGSLASGTGVSSSHGHVTVAPARGVTSCSGLRAAPGASHIDMFVSRLDPNTSETIIKNHLHEHSIEVSNVEALDTKHPSYSSFKITIPSSKFRLFRSTPVWPEGVYVRKFYGTRNANN